MTRSGFFKLLAFSPLAALIKRRPDEAVTMSGLAQTLPAPDQFTSVLTVTNGPDFTIYGNNLPPGVHVSDNIARYGTIANT